MYATKTTFAATTAVMAAKVELPGMQKVRKESRGRMNLRSCTPFHMYFSDA
jgi:hypothetical protein